MRQLTQNGDELKAMSQTLFSIMSRAFIKTDRCRVTAGIPQPIASFRRPWIVHHMQGEFISKRGNPFVS
jgi:hypothetical protein